MLPALSSACKRNASMSRVPALPSKLHRASGDNLFCWIKCVHCIHKVIILGVINSNAVNSRD
jgi:hypothetical protein